MELKKLTIACSALPFLLACGTAAHRSGEPVAPWTFVVSGDSRNCGDVVMPSIASAARDAGATFYWHLGDFRALYKVDEDIAARPEFKAKALTMPDYQKIAWKDFIDHELKPFGDLPIHLAIGNHELIRRTRAEYLATFGDWLAPGAQSGKTTYETWRVANVAFISLDNASDEQFDETQLAWIHKTLDEAVGDAKIATIVVGMHAALPDSLSFRHSMSASKNPNAVRTGREVYASLLKAQNDSHKRVYVLMSHSHYFMEGIFNTPHWKSHGGILPGWIIGTAGAERIPLPPEAKDAARAVAHTYGYLLATVSQDGNVSFDFKTVNRSQVRKSVEDEYGPQSELVNTCFSGNAQAKGY